MHQTYKVFKNNTPMEIKNQYFQECVSAEKVNIVIITRRKYASLTYDFNTLNLGQKEIKDSSKCNIEAKIKAYAYNYAKENHLPLSRYPKTVTDISGAFEIYIEDVEQVGDDIAKIIEDILKSGCMEFRTLEEILQSMDPELRAKMETIYA